jgi:hypothetical protein
MYPASNIEKGLRVMGSRKHSDNSDAMYSIVYGTQLWDRILR